jgi:hypothetical protein
VRFFSRAVLMDVGSRTSFSCEFRPHSLKRKGLNIFKSGLAFPTDPVHTKRIRGGEGHSNEKYEDDKENIHRALHFRERTRSSKVLHTLTIDVPTDCSDIEIELDSSDNDRFAGVLFHRQTERIGDTTNVHHNFSVYEDQPAN